MDVRCRADSAREALLGVGGSASRRGFFFRFPRVTSDWDGLYNHFGLSWAPSMFVQFSRISHYCTMIILLSFTGAGCGSSPQPDESKTAGQAVDQKKIQELSKKGYDFNEIRSIMSGEEPKPKPKQKKQGGARR